MRSIHVAMLALALSVPLPSAAQSGAANPVSPDTSQPAPKKKGGLFGKVKALTQNKTLQQVAKTAACNMVPGGQMLTGALDKGKTEDAAKDAAQDAAKGAAVGAAAGLAGGKNPCMPGIGNPNPSALAGGVPGAGLPGMPTVSTPGVGMSAQQMQQLQEQYQKMGMNPAQIQAMQQQMTASQGAGMSADQMKQLMDQYKKMGMDPAQLQAMQNMMAGMSPAAAAAPGSAVATPSAEAIPAPTLKKEKNRFVLRQLPWLPNSESIRPGSEEAFTAAIHGLATELQPGRSHYKLEVKVEDQGSKAQSQALAQQRAAVVVSFLVAQGLSESRLVIVDGAGDKDARVIVSESKSGK